MNADVTLIYRHHGCEGHNDICSINIGGNQYYVVLIFEGHEIGSSYSEFLESVRVLDPSKVELEEHFIEKILGEIQRNAQNSR